MLSNIGAYMIGDQDTRFVIDAWFDWSEVSEDSYFHKIPALTSSSAIPFSSNVTFLTGENGCGKSSVIEAVASACGFQRSGGTMRDYKHSDNSASELGRACHVSRNGRRPIDNGFFFRAETFFNIARGMPMTRDVGISGKAASTYLEMSHGEGFLEFLQSQQYAGLFLMDEPEAALSPQRQLTLLLHMHRMALSGSQFLIVTHSPILLGLPGSSILNFNESGIEECSWEDTESYQIMKMFLDSREAVLYHLLDSEE